MNHAPHSHVNIYTIYAFIIMRESSKTEHRIARSKNKAIPRTRPIQPGRDPTRRAMTSRATYQCCRGAAAKSAHTPHAYIPIPPLPAIQNPAPAFERNGHVPPAAAWRRVRFGLSEDDPETRERGHRRVTGLYEGRERRSARVEGWAGTGVCSLWKGASRRTGQRERERRDEHSSSELVGETR